MSVAIREVPQELTRTFFLLCNGEQLQVPCDSKYSSHYPMRMRLIEVYATAMNWAREKCHGVPNDLLPLPTHNLSNAIAYNKRASAIAVEL